MKILIPLCLSLFLFACSDLPNDKLIKDQLIKSVKNDSSVAFLEVKNFEKLNGYSESDTKYLAEIKYDLVFTKSLYEVKKILQKEAKSTNQPFAEAGVKMVAMALQLQYGNFEAGKSVRIEEEVTLVNTEKGWMIKS